MPSDHRYIEIDLAALHEALGKPLPLIENPERRADVERYVALAEVHVERAVYDLLARLFEQINRLERGAELRLEYRGRRLGVSVEAQPAAAEPESTFATDVEGDVEKVTIRLPGELRNLINQAANLRGLSQNSWYLRELARAIARQAPEPPEPPPPPGGRGRGSRLHGYVGD